MVSYAAIARACQVLAIAGLITLAGCDMGPKSGYGFALPDGDAAAGETHFLRLRCNDCHSVQGRPELRSAAFEPLMTVPLGGTTTRIATYGDLVTSVINPSHRISQRYLDEPVEAGGLSTMRNYNDVMTVAELIDLVAFLQAQYELEPYVGPSYRSYHYP